MQTDETDHDVVATWEAIERWYEAHAPESFAELAPPATPSAIEELALRTGIAVPRDVATSILRHDGSGRIHGLDALDADWCAKEWELMQVRVARGDFAGLVPADESGARFANTWWSPKWLPVARHAAGTLVVVDTHPGPEGTYGQILELHPYDEGPAATRWTSFAHWLAGYLHDLQSGVYRTDAEGNLDRVVHAE